MDVFNDGDFVQDPSERSDCRSRWYQFGGSDPAVCCYGAEEHKGNSSVSAELVPL